ncbi:MAG: hypothetical protein GF350_09755 [Chitinivibrionales bacterium]|nr:hypothetical protein [Chitinivibrionales bacterium]
MIKYLHFFMICMMPLAAFSQELKTDVSLSVKVAVVFENTKFKSKLVETLKKKLEESNAAVTVAQHSKEGVALENPELYDAIFITNSGVRSMVRPWISSWLDSHTDIAPKILLHTTKTKNWEEQVSVDAVSSASAMNQVDSLAGEYAQKVLKLAQQDNAGQVNEKE